MRYENTRHFASPFTIAARHGPLIIIATPLFFMPIHKMPESRAATPRIIAYGADMRAMPPPMHGKS